LEIAQVPYTEILYDWKTPELWYNKDKQELPLDFPNLPNIKTSSGIWLSESIAILQYICTKYGLAGDSIEEQAVVNMIIFAAADLRSDIGSPSNGFCYAKDNLKDKRHVLLSEIAPKFLQEFTKILKKGKGTWFVGSKVTIADVFVYDILDQLLVLEKEILGCFPELLAFTKEFEKIDSVHAYLTSPKCIRVPLYNPSKAHFTGK
jgi:glutathione S-transferase